MTSIVAMHFMNTISPHGYVVQRTGILVAGERRLICPIENYLFCIKVRH